jgi:coenzyme F420 hydrogenase subunit beta
MSIDGEGFSRPSARTRFAEPVDAATDRARARWFGDICPGVAVRRPAEVGHRDAIFGTTRAVWAGHASDPRLRHVGSSGGLLSALTAWLLESGQALRVVAAAADGEHPAVSRSVSLRSPAEVAEAAGSRYAPVSTAANPDVMLSDSAVVAKPCEASALRGLWGQRGIDPPLLLSFFCAGVPSQNATENLVRRLGLDPADLAGLRYRGHGWPGRFTATSRDGRQVGCSYQQSWGAALGPTMQWRCKICVDGVGELSDLTAGDLWDTDDRGYPLFAEAQGVSVLIARTARGEAVARAAVDAGVIDVQPVDLSRVYAAQPYQVERRSTLAGRLLGARLAGHPLPRYQGFGLLRLAAGHPASSLRAAAGSFRRTLRAGRGSPP